VLSAVLRWAVLQSSRKRGETALVFIASPPTLPWWPSRSSKWRIVVLTREAHAMAQGGFDAPEALANVAEEAD
jgi:hypothetical protein